MGFGVLFGIGLPWTPWRAPYTNFKWKKETAEKLQKDINDILPTAETGLKKFKVLTIGTHGHGKSSLINTLASISVGEKTTVCNAAPMDENVTTHYRTFDFLGHLGNCVLGDICGPLPTAKDIQPMLDDIKAILKGNIKSGYKFDPKKSISEQDDYFKESPKFSDRTHCVIIVIDSLQAYELPPSYVLNMEKIMKTINELNIPVIAVLTKADLLSEHVEYSIASIFRCRKIQKSVDDTAKQLKLPAPKVFPLVNFEAMDSFTWKESIPVLITLKSFLRMAQQHSRNADEVKKE
ncbi:interferon-induced protein 44-like [Ruditapes philippinarum]|uniref:interferon-induced protein 44-like n=1 Tax=Ruditapes philippinarum TaxID=129788 RepID=UPI00295B0868|nr:interferon-induced protein 44-like [Ruditapes philippinarum]